MGTGSALCSASRPPPGLGGTPNQSQPCRGECCPSRRCPEAGAHGREHGAGAGKHSKQEHFQLQSGFIKVWLIVVPAWRMRFAMLYALPHPTSSTPHSTMQHPIQHHAALRTAACSTPHSTMQHTIQHSTALHTAPCGTLIIAHGITQYSQERLSRPWLIAWHGMAWLMIWPLSAHHSQHDGMAHDMATLSTPLSA